jgi:hypothetical protein
MAGGTYAKALCKPNEITKRVLRQPSNNINRKMLDS